MSRYYRRISGIALLGLLAGTLGGCDSFLDVNENPNAPETVRMELTLPAVIMEHTEDLDQYQVASWSSQWMNQFTWNRETYGYSQRHRYEMTAIDADNPWTPFYVETGNEAKNIIRRSTEMGAPHYTGIAKLILAWKGSQLTDAWGPIPWSEAFNPLKRDPVYDEQKDVYASIHQMLTEAIADMSQPATPAMIAPGANDLLYGGAMSQWIKLARTLQARLHLRLVYAPGENPQQRAQAALDALAQGFTSTADDALINYPGGSGYRQPRYGSAANGNYGDGSWNFQNRASEYFVELLKGFDDPRLPVMFDPALIDGEFRGAANGVPQADSLISGIGEVIWGETVPFRWLTFAEAKFIEAEARLIVSGAAAADAPYRAGIRAHMETLGVTSDDRPLRRVAPAEIDAYLAALPPLGSLARPLEAIITQKYIANFVDGEAWNDWRRTGYPVMEPLAADYEPYLPEIPQRLRTPSYEYTRNTANVLATGIPTTLDGMLTKVWWASGSRTVQ